MTTLDFTPDPDPDGAEAEAEAESDATPESGTYREADGVRHYTYDRGEWMLDSLHEGSELWVALLTDSYEPDLSDHTRIEHVWSHEPDSPSYQSGGLPIDGLQVHGTQANTKFYGSDVVWETATSITARYAVIYEAGMNDLISLIDFGHSVTAVSRSDEPAEFEITWAERPIFESFHHENETGTA